MPRTGQRTNVYIHIYFLNFLFYIRLELINNVVLVSGMQQRDSAIHIHVAILFQILSPTMCISYSITLLSVVYWDGLLTAAPGYRGN